MRWSVVVPVALAADQLSKLAVVRTMVRGESIPVLGDYLRLTYIHNSGAAFGLRLGGPWLHTAVSLIALGALLWLFITAPRDNRLMRFALCLVLGGALGNIVDRVRLQAVVDFVDVGIGGLRWPVFNVADSCVTLGIGMLALAYYRQDRTQRAPPARCGEPTPESQAAGDSG